MWSVIKSLSPGVGLVSPFGEQDNNSLFPFSHIKETHRRLIFIQHNKINDKYSCEIQVQTNINESTFVI